MANYSAELYREKTLLEELIVAEIKNRIIDLDLIDTGKLYASIKCNIKLNNDGYTTEVRGTDYWKYVNGNYKVLDSVLMIPRVSRAATELYATMVLESL